MTMLLITLLIGQAVTSGDQEARMLWGLLIYFLFGAIGTFGRVALSPVMEAGANKRTYLETFFGGIYGMLLPYLGSGLAAVTGMNTEAMFAGTPPWVRTILTGALICTLSGSSSLVAGEIRSQLKIRSEAKANGG